MYAQIVRQVEIRRSAVQAHIEPGQAGNRIFELIARNCSGPGIDALAKCIGDLRIHSIRQLFAKHPDLREFFDLPQATPQQRAACFAAGASHAHGHNLRYFCATL